MAWLLQLSESEEDGETKCEERVFALCQEGDDVAVLLAEESGEEEVRNFRHHTIEEGRNGLVSGVESDVGISRCNGSGCSIVHLRYLHIRRRSG